MELAKFIRPYPCRIGELKTPQQEMFKIAYPCQRTMIEEAACVILPYFKQKYPLSEDKNGYGLMDYGAAWALVENMRLAATAECSCTVEKHKAKQRQPVLPLFRSQGNAIEKFIAVCYT